MRSDVCSTCAAIGLGLVLAAVSAPAAAAADPYIFKILKVEGTTAGSPPTPGSFPRVTFAVTTPTGTPVLLGVDPAWTAVAPNVALNLRIGWDLPLGSAPANGTEEFTNTLSGSGPALPIAASGLGLTPNSDGSYTVQFKSAIPLGVTGSLRVEMEGHPAAPDATGKYTVRVPIRSVYQDVPVAGTNVRRAVVDGNKCMNCHRVDGTGAAPRLSVHGNNRTDEVRVCVVCHNPNNTDVTQRNVNTAVDPVTGATINRNPTVTVGPYTFPEQGIDFKRLIHGIHATTAGFRRTPLVVMAFGSTPFNASTLKRYPAELRNCVNCHIDNGSTGTFELPVATGVLGSTMNTRSTTVNANGTFLVDLDPANDVKISPTAAACSSCHDNQETISHMVRTGGASFNTTQSALDLGSVRERCVSCHGPGREESVRNAHEISGGSGGGRPD